MDFQQGASRLHKKIGEILSSTLPFSGFDLKQEVPVSSLFKSYSNNRDKYDWVIPDLFLIIEGNGQQHYKPVTFGGSVVDAEFKFQSQRFKDRQKEEIAILNGWTFFSIPYTDEKIIDSKYLLEKYQQHFVSAVVKLQKEVPGKTGWGRSPEKIEEDRQKTRAYQRDRYQQMKEYKKNHGIK